MRVIVSNQAARHRAQQREGIERGDVRIVPILLVQSTHRVGVTLAPSARIAVTEQDLDGCNQRLFRRRPAVAAARGGRTHQDGAARACCGDVLPAPERLVVGHRLAPVDAIAKPGSSALSLAEGLVGVLVFEQVERGQPLGEISPVLRVDRRCWKTHHRARGGLSLRFGRATAISRSPHSAAATHRPAARMPVFIAFEKLVLRLV